MAAVVGTVLVANGLFNAWFSYEEYKAAFIRTQHQQALAAAAKIGQFVEEIRNQLGWITGLPWSAVTPEQRHLDALRLLKEVPAITELSLLDNSGREQLRISRIAIDRIGSGRDFSHEAAFVEAEAHGVYFGPVYFRHGSEPYLTVARSRSRRDAGVAIAEVNLVYVWDVVSQIKVGDKGYAYVVDASGRLIAHPDIGLVLRNTDVSDLAPVKAARLDRPADIASTPTKDLQGRSVLAAYAPIAPLGWAVFVELPLNEALAPVYASLVTNALILLAGLALATFASLALARRMMRPITTLQTGAALIGAGALDHRIEIRSGDELEALGDQFNNMAAQLQDSYAHLERKVEQRTHQLELANLSKSRFLAAASHDLRQPLHALNLFLAQLHGETDPVERGRVVAQIDAAVAAMNELFNALLDISKLDAHALKPSITQFPLDRLLRRIETTFMAAAREKGLRFRVLSSNAWVCSDFILLERILLNLVSNAARYTTKGGVLVGCRRRGSVVTIEVWDSGVGIPADQHRNIFGEFYQLTSDHERRSGLGLGLAIVDRLCRLLDHPITVDSRFGRGSRFTVSVPLVPPARAGDHPPVAATYQLARKLVLIIDDDPLVLDAMRGLLQSWGCGVATAASERAALTALAGGCAPDLIISDYRLGDGTTGFELIEHLRAAFGAPVAAFLISGDTAPERLQEASACGYCLLHKPVLPMTLRATISHLLGDHEGGARRN
jgi:signal transduction histidine kinase/CheY-like chemotaxis protein